MKYKKRPIAERFWPKVDKRGPGECWPWRGTRDVDGYGKIWRIDRPWQAHRVAWELAHGEIPDGLFVCHHCDNPRCVNPKHLFTGTTQDNMDDMARKGRQSKGMRHPRAGHPSFNVPCGEDSPHARLTTTDVIDIRASGESQRSLGRKYGVNPTHISRIRRRVAWAHVD